jgi:hypothetical protein
MVFVAAGAGAMLIALITISYQSLKVALANLMNSLRAD